MKESDLNKRAVDFALRYCPRAVYYKHADSFTSGIPDSTFSWRENTSWLEFKHLDPNEGIHKQLKTLQLTELVKLEHACHRAWVIAFRRPNARALVKPQTIIYRPTALLHGREPRAERKSNIVAMMSDLELFGIAQFEGHYYEALVALLHQTHPAEAMPRCSV